MIDASMILHQESLYQMIELAKANALGQIVISDTFVKIIEDPNASNDLFSRLSKFFEIDEELIDKEAIKKFLFSDEYSVNIERYYQENSHNDKFYKKLSEAAENELIGQILFEEWDFLATHSWLLAKVRAAFDKIVEAGGTAIYVSKLAFEVAVRKSIKKPEGQLSPNDKLRATAKWVAVGGSVLIDSIVPTGGAIFKMASGIFLLCDP